MTKQQLVNALSTDNDFLSDSEIPENMTLAEIKEYLNTNFSETDLQEFYDEMQISKADAFGR